MLKFLKIISSVLIITCCIRLFFTVLGLHLLLYGPGSDYIHLDGMESLSVWSMFSMNALFSVGLIILVFISLHNHDNDKNNNFISRNNVFVMLVLSCIFLATVLLNNISRDIVILKMPEWEEYVNFKEYFISISYLSLISVMSYTALCYLNSYGHVRSDQNAQ